MSYWVIVFTNIFSTLELFHDSLQCWTNFFSFATTKVNSNLLWPRGVLLLVRKYPHTGDYYYLGIVDGRHQISNKMMKCAQSPLVMQSIWISRYLLWYWVGNTYQVNRKLSRAKCECSNIGELWLYCHTRSILKCQLSWKSESHGLQDGPQSGIIICQTEHSLLHIVA
jgi:hypothetical protein